MFAAGDAEQMIGISTSTPTNEPAIIAEQERYNL